MNLGGINNGSEITKRKLLNSSPHALRRLARFMHLHVHPEMSDKQVAKLIYWRITRVDYGRMY